MTHPTLVDLLLVFLAAASGALLGGALARWKAWHEIEKIRVALSSLGLIVIGTYRVVSRKHPGEPEKEAAKFLRED